MACDTWIPHLVSLVYDEIDPDDAGRLREHVASCRSCAQALDELRSTREVVRGALPAVPEVPRVVILTRPVRWQLRHAVAAGIVAALLVGAGSIGGYLLKARPEPPSPVAAASKAPDGELERRIESLEAALAAGSRVVPAAEPSRRIEAPAPLTAGDLRAALTRLENKLEGSRAADIDYVMGEIRASELRTQSWIGDTREALRYVALANNPGVGQR